MYKVLNINGEDYKLEYTIEASLYSDCVASVMALMTDLSMIEGKDDIKKMLVGISNVPQTTLTIFYAGLLEAHGSHPDGDGKVPDIHAAKRLIAQYMREHKEDGTGNFYNIMQMCIEQMGEDNFFELTGITAAMNSMTQHKENAKKKPRENGKASEK